MSKIIRNAIDNLRAEIKKTSNLSDDLVFGLVCYKYFYNEGRFDKTDLDNAFTDGAGDGGIDLIAVNETDLAKRLVLIQSKNIQDIESKDQIKDIFTKMAQTIEDFKNEKVGSYSEKLRRIYREKYDDASDDVNFNIELVLFLGIDKKESYKEKIKLHLSKVTELEDYEISIFFENEIEQQIVSFEDGNRFVSYGEIGIFKDHGQIKLNENGILVNISALSLRKLYDKYKDKGLFEQNFRYFISNQKIDGQINESLKSKRDRFWFLNNGIIIGCKEFYPDGNNIKLEDFSIVNGCQTTTNLGRYEGLHEDLDFPIPCKIVKPDKPGEDYFNIFISEIAESSNSQKPISDRDLRSNLREQRQLQKALRENNPKIFLEIKRGEQAVKNKNIESWQKIKNDELGQLMLSVLLQQPGTARSSKKKIFSDNNIYNRIFKEKHDIPTIVDLLKLSFFYDECFRSIPSLGEDMSNVAKNGKLCVLGIIGFLIKNKRKQINLKLDSKSSDWASDVMVDNLQGELFDPNRPDDFQEVLNSLFLQITRTLATLYTSLGATETSVTNFFKTDKKYHSIILERIKQEYLLDPYENKKLQEKIKLLFL